MGTTGRQPEKKRRQTDAALLRSASWASGDPNRPWHGPCPGVAAVATTHQGAGLPRAALWTTTSGVVGGCWGGGGGRGRGEIRVGGEFRDIVRDIVLYRQDDHDCHPESMWLRERDV